MKQKEIRYLENLLKKKKEKIEEMARKIKKNRKNRQKQPADKVIEKKSLQVKRKKVSKPIFHTVFKFIDKHTFAIFCILILIMIIVGGLYLLQNQKLKEDTSVTPMITNEPLTDSPPPILDPTDAPPKDRYNLFRHSNNDCNYSGRSLCRRKFANYVIRRHARIFYCRNNNVSSSFWIIRCINWLNIITR